MGSTRGSKDKGRKGENMAVAWLQRWWPNAERRRLQGAKDCGDISGTPFVVEVKNAESWAIHKWRGELREERNNASIKGLVNLEAQGFIMARRNRDEWVFIVPEDVMQELLDAIYGRPKSE